MDSFRKPIMPIFGLLIGVSLNQSGVQLAKLPISNMIRHHAMQVIISNTRKTETVITSGDVTTYQGVLVPHLTLR